MRKAVNAGPTDFYDRNGKLVGAFVPNGSLRPNKKLWGSTEATQAARLFVGFNVGDSPRWSLSRLMELVKEIRREQGEKPDASFVYQRGFYTHETRTPAGRKRKNLVEEEGAQIVVLNIYGTPKKTFERQMRQLADKIAYAMKQESVIIEFQEGGKTYETVAMGPTPRG